MDKAKISVVILAKNEESRIKDCIQSVTGFADEIIVIDDESTDKTVALSTELSATVFIKKMDVEGSHRNWAYSKARNSWIFSLDADERFTPELKDEINSVLAKNPEENAFTVPRRNHIGNYWLRWGGQYPSAQIKLFRKEKFKWEEVEVHPRAFLDGKCGHLTKDLIHYTYRDWEDFLKKLNNQTTLEAKKWYKYSFENPKKAQYKMNTFHALWRTFDRFVRTYVGKKGCRDGFNGFMIAYFASLYQIVSYAKYRGLKNKDNAPRS